MSYKSNYTGEQIDKVIGDNLEVNIKDLKRELDDAKDIVTYDITELGNNVEQIESRQQVELNVDLINKVFGSPDSLMYNLENKHVRFTTLNDGNVSNTDVTSSITIGETEGYLSLTYEVVLLGETVVTSSYLFIFDKTKEPHTFTYGHVTRYTDDDQITTGFIKDEAVTTEKIANKAITLDKIADEVLSSFSSIIDKGILNEGNIRGVCESTETGIFKFIDGDNRLNCLLFKPYQPKGNYEYMCLTHAEDGDLNIAVRGGDGGGHGGWQYITETSITPDSTKPISSGAVYNAIYSVLNTEV